MKKAVVKPGGHECPVCGGDRFEQGGGTMRKLLFGTNADDRTITCISAERDSRRHRRRSCSPKEHCSSSAPLGLAGTSS